jgi:hypothetical protein
MSSRTLDLTLWPGPAISYFEIKVKIFNQRIGPNHTLGKHNFDDPLEIIIVLVTRRTRYDFVWVQVDFTFGDYLSLE